jgi:hypothetical protein
MTGKKLSKVIRVALLDIKTKRFIEYLVDTGNYKKAEDIAKAQALEDGYDLKTYGTAVMAEMPILKGA